METKIYYYSGSGNSLWVARTLTARLGDADLVSIADWTENEQTSGAKVVGVVFPVFVWGVPSHVIRFVNALRDFGDYAFAVATNGGQLANTLVQLGKIFRKRGAFLSAGFGINMPSSYIPWGGPGPEEERRRRFEAALTKIGDIAACVKNRETRPVEKGLLWHRVVFTPLYKLTFPKIHGWDKNFWVDEKCNGCAVCTKVCPSLNVTLVAGKPVWCHRCEQCFACLQWCPHRISRQLQCFLKSVIRPFLWFCCI
jgi:flavodoxin/Pyruvate/2-oxoacid:ferredoxin oxidoreductase delta subunit